MVTELNWESIKEIYQEKFGIDGWVVEVYANLDILTLCASGASNKTIERFLEIPIEDIKSVIRDTFDFDGWEEDLPISPYNIYTSMESTHEQDTLALDFIPCLNHLLQPYPKFRNLDLPGLYRICKTLRDIEERITNEWI